MPDIIHRKRELSTVGIKEYLAQRNIETINNRVTESEFHTKRIDHSKMTPLRNQKSKDFREYTENQR